MSEETQIEVAENAEPQPENTEPVSENTEPQPVSAEKPKKQWKKPTKKQVAHEIVSWLLMTLGTVLVAAGVYFFKAPNHFATGGVSGLSIIIAKYVPLNQSSLVMIINVLLLIIGLIFLGKGCTVRTLYCSVMYSLENFLLEQFLPIELITKANPTADGLYTLTNQPLMELVFAMLLTGIGSAIMFNCKASSGGTDENQHRQGAFDNRRDNRVFNLLYFRRSGGTVFHTRTVFQGIHCRRRNRKYRQDEIYYDYNRHTRRDREVHT